VQYVYHLEVRKASGFSWEKSKTSENHSALQLTAPLPWWLIEVLSFLGLCFILFVKARKFNMINVHIAYPLLTYFHLIKKFVNKPVVITEHWSAYHFNFGVKKQLPRIKRIFENNLPLITVSQSLLSDIEKFSKRSCSKTCVVPNAIDINTFYRQEKRLPSQPSFFIGANWKWPKRPDVILKAFAEFLRDEQFACYHLRIGGYGVQIKEMEALMDALEISKNVVLLGGLNSVEVADEMNRSQAFLHCSEYETFSVVCAEAACCGTPVIASAVGGIPEFINESNGILVPNNTVSEWSTAMKKAMTTSFDHAYNSKVAQQMFSSRKTGFRYFNFLKDIGSAYK
jgi:glycosyltransferase involved in cell wall biosynthesis